MTLLTIGDENDGDNVLTTRRRRRMMATTTMLIMMTLLTIKIDGGDVLRRRRI